MKYSAIILGALVLLCASSLSVWGQPAAEGSPTYNYYGAWDSAATAPALSVSAAMKDTSLYGREVVVEGVIADVCRKKGCWLVVSDPQNGGAQMRVTFKDYAFFVPTNSDGQRVRLQGVISVEEIPEDLAKHYAEESKEENPDDITGPQRVVTMEATGVKMTSVAAK